MIQHDIYSKSATMKVIIIISRESENHLIIILKYHVIFTKQAKMITCKTNNNWLFRPRCGVMRMRGRVPLLIGCTLISSISSSILVNQMTLPFFHKNISTTDYTDVSQQ